MTFNLITEPWIQVLDHNGRIQEVSLTDAIIHAQDYERLAGESQAQNFAVFRLILAVLLTIYSRLDEEGEEEPIEDATDALSRWKAIWKEGKFEPEVIKAYLNQWSDRFDLFNPERPFGQVPAARIGTDYKASKLIGDMSESNHKLRLFALRALEGKESISPGEAARWLLYVNGYDDTSLKKKTTNGDGSPGAGWLGKIGIFYPEGESLFETLMYNLMLLDRNGSPWPEPKPAWEREKIRESERTLISLPDNLPELFTLSSRRLLLKQEEGAVTGYTAYGGDFFPREDALVEPHTIWTKSSATKKNEPVIFVPKRNDPARQIWRDFSNILIEDDTVKTPGIITWIDRLRKKKLIKPDTAIVFRTCGVKYGDKDFFVNDSVGDDLTLTTSLIADTGDWKDSVQKEVGKITELARAAGYMAGNIALAAGSDVECIEKSVRQPARERIYDLVNLPFKKWIAGLNPDDEDEMDAKMNEWADQARKISSVFIREQTAGASPKAYLGRRISNDDSERHYSLPEAVNYFQHVVNQLYPRED